MRKETMPKRKLRLSHHLPILLLAVSGCALMDSPRRQDRVREYRQPTAFKQILIDRESVALSDVVAVLLSKGYRSSGILRTRRPQSIESVLERSL